MLKKNLAKYNFTKIFDLQNSSRTKFYKRFILKNVEWSSTETSLEPGQKKSDFDKDPVLDRMEIQLKKSGIQTEFVKNIDLSWAISDISRLKKQYANNDYILLFPFCSKKLPQKKWPFFKDLIEYMTSGPVIIQVLEGDNAIENYRKIMGATNPENADKGTIREKYALNIQENSVHGSDSLENANIEISYFFEEKEIIS